MLYKQSPGALASLLLMALVLLWIGTPSHAQGSPASPPAETTRPDMMIVAFPFLNGQWLVSTVYSGKESRQQAERRARRLLELARWEAGNFEYEQKSLEQVGKDFEFKPPVMASLTFTVNGSLLAADGTLALEPFLLAFRDLNRFQLTLAKPEGFVYRGPQFFSDNRVEFYCRDGEGSLNFMVKIKDHTLERLDLPQYQTDRSAGEAATSARRGTAPATPPVLVLAVMASLAAGVGVFLLVRRSLMR